VSSARDQLAVPPARFIRQLEIIEKSGLPIVDLAAALATDDGALANSLAFTFDDGYADFLENALPELSTRGWPATVFVVPDAIEGRVRYPWYPREQPRLITWSEMLDVERSGLVRFEPHSLTHVPLSAVSDEDAWLEIAGSKRIVADALGREAHLFCYPGGYHGVREKEMVERAGYLGAVTGEPGVNGRDFHRFALRRISIDRYDTSGVFSARLRGATDRRPLGVRSRAL
jgi:peptidoglycan/xylan/chitin deacetylase (PgdA/CDA1 family)